MFVKEFPNGLPEHLRGKVLGDKAFTPFADIITPPTLETLKRFVGSEELHRCLFKLMSASELVSWVRSRIEGMFGVSSLLKYGVKLVVVGRARRSTFGRRVDRDAALERHELAALQGMCALTVFIEECSFQLKVGCGSRYTTPLWLAQAFHAHRHITTLQFYGEELLKTAAASRYRGRPSHVHAGHHALVHVRGDLYRGVLSAKATGIVVGARAHGGQLEDPRKHPLRG